jgi:hypothetical protein
MAEKYNIKSQSNATLQAMAGLEGQTPDVIGGCSSVGSCFVKGTRLIQTRSSEQDLASLFGMKHHQKSVPLCKIVN